jgi:ubiquinone/menaquinone biosynthesis C-methylase UbiE
MPDVYATISEAAPETQERLADVIEKRSGDVRHQAMVRAYLAEIDFPPQAQVLEIGCGTGAITRTLAQWQGVAQAHGIDPSPVFVARARALSQNIPNIAFEQGDGRALTLGANTFDIVVIHTTLSHVPQPQQALAEAFRVLKPRGWLAICDGDYATATVSLGDNDPLAVCINAFRENFVNDSWLVRRLPSLLQTVGFEVMPMRSHGYVEAPEADYMLTWIDRGADVLASMGRIGKETAEALKAEARRRSASGTWFGHIAFASILSRKP